MCQSHRALILNQLLNSYITIIPLDYFAERRGPPTAQMGFGLAAILGVLSLPLLLVGSEAGWVVGGITIIILLAPTYRAQKDGLLTK